MKSCVKRTSDLANFKTQWISHSRFDRWRLLLLYGMNSKDANTHTESTYDKPYESAQIGEQCLYRCSLQLKQHCWVCGALAFMLDYY